MLRTLTAALVATTLVAGTAFAADSGNAGSANTPAAPAATTNVKAGDAAKSANAGTNVGSKTVKHVRKNTRKHVSHVKSGKMHQARHVKGGKGTKTHQANGPAPAQRS